MSESAPTTIGRYEIRRELGRGTMGVVYEAVDPALGRTVALKTIAIALSVPGVEREVFEQRFVTEARVAARLSHPNVVVVHDVGRDPATGIPFMALEYLRGRTLAELTEAGVPLDWREALRITARLADALHAAHIEGIVHRDIKPANVMLLPSGEPKIMDFGIAKAPASQLTMAGQVFGTPANMSPEQARGELLDARSDLFSLGTVLYQLLTGRRAFAGASLPQIILAVIQQDPPLPSRVVPGIPADVDALLARALAKAPEDRYPHGRAMAEDIEDILADRAPRYLAGLKRLEEAEGPLAGPSAEPELELVPDEAAGPGPGPAMTSATSPLESLVAEAPAAVPAVPRRTSGPAPSVAAGPTRRVERRPRLVVLAGSAAVLLAALGLALSIRQQSKPAAVPPATPLLPGTSFPGAEAARPDVPAPGSDLAGEPARLVIDFDHHLRSGTLRVWIDDDPVLDERLEGRTSLKVAGLRLRTGSLARVLDVAPGRHRIRVRVNWDDNTRTEAISGTFRAGGARTLEVSVGRLRKNLSLDWR